MHSKHLGRRTQRQKRQAQRLASRAHWLRLTLGQSMVTFDRSAASMTVEQRVAKAMQDLLDQMVEEALGLRPMPAGGRVLTLADFDALVNATMGLQEKERNRWQ